MHLLGGSVRSGSRSVLSLFFLPLKYEPTLTQIVNSECAMAQPPKRIYLAGFSEAGNEFKVALVKKLSDLGYEVVGPVQINTAKQIRGD
jgi:hypothetical protein